MFCEKCGESNENGVKFCKKCGTPMMSVYANSNQINYDSEKKGNGGIIIFVLLLVIFMIIGGVIGGFIGSAKAKNDLLFTKKIGFVIENEV